MAVIDQSRSGVGIVADLVQRWGYSPPPSFVWAIQDRDLWKFELDHTPAVTAAITARPYEIAEWDSFVTDDLIVEGSAILRFRDRLISDTLSLQPINVMVAGWLVPMLPCPYTIGSDVAGRLAEENPAGVGGYFIQSGSGVSIGLRSRGDGPDVSQMAERYAGGGHKHASGFRVNTAQFLSMMT